MTDAAASRTTERRQALILSLVHPDFLAPLYSISEVLRDALFDVNLFTFSSLAKTGRETDGAFTLHDCGPHAGSVVQRWRKRHDLARRAASWAYANPPEVIFASCPYSFMLARRISARAIPVVYVAFEVYAPTINGLFRSPATTVRSWRARRTLADAAVVCTPSAERAAWLQQHSRLSKPPVVLLNAPYGLGVSLSVLQRNAVRATWLPAAIRSKRLILHTGSVTSTQGVRELVESVALWPEDTALVLTRVGHDSYSQSVRDAAALSVRRDDIVLLPMLSRSEMLDIQRAADIGVCFLREGATLSASLPAPNKIGEYLHAGLFVIGTKSGYMSELERRGVAFSVEALEPSAISHCVSRAVAHASSIAAREKVQCAVAGWYRMEVQLAPVLAALEEDHGLAVSDSSAVCVSP